MPYYDIICAIRHIFNINQQVWLNAIDNYNSNNLRVCPYIWNVSDVTHMVCHLNILSHHALAGVMTDRNVRSNLNITPLNNGTFIWPASTHCIKTSHRHRGLAYCPTCSTIQDNVTIRQMKTMLKTPFKLAQHALSFQDIKTYVCVWRCVGGGGGGGVLYMVLMVKCLNSH